MQPQIEEWVEPFLKACLKLLWNPYAVGNLQALPNTYVVQTNMILETKDVNKLYIYKKHIGREMRLTTQIGDYEMD